MTNEIIGGKTKDEWERLWQPVPGGLTCDQEWLRGMIGLFRVTLNGEYMFIGKGVETKRGLKKRLRDFNRYDTSGRNHYGGKFIYKNLEVVDIEVLLIDPDWLTPNLAKDLRDAMIDWHKPIWNQKKSVINAKRDAVRLARTKGKPQPSIKTISAAEVIVAQSA